MLTRGKCGKEKFRGCLRLRIDFQCQVDGFLNVGRVFCSGLGRGQASFCVNSVDSNVKADDFRILLVLKGQLKILSHSLMPVFGESQRALAELPLRLHLDRTAGTDLHHRGNCRLGSIRPELWASNVIEPRKSASENAAAGFISGSY